MCKHRSGVYGNHTERRRGKTRDPRSVQGLYFLPEDGLPQLWSTHTLSHLTQAPPSCCINLPDAEG
jgi:hypothetical protein